jgi:hypothetical protein
MTSPRVGLSDPATAGRVTGGFSLNTSTAIIFVLFLSYLPIAGVSKKHEL